MHEILGNTLLDMDFPVQLMGHEISGLIQCNVIQSVYIRHINMHNPNTGYSPGSFLSEYHNITIVSNSWKEGTDPDNNSL